jgi:hypothetical protein
VPLFLANGFYKNMTEFKREHVVYASYVKFPKIDGYRREGHLLKLKSQILVEMPVVSVRERIINKIPVHSDEAAVQKLIKTRWNPFTDSPVESASEMFFTLMKIVNSDPSRAETIVDLLRAHPRIIVFYSYNYELEILRKKLSGIVEIGEWNGHQKDPLPRGQSWVYLVQFTSGSEGWNCIETDTILFYSLPYSYKNYAQAMGRIDRLNSPFMKLYYYILWPKNLFGQKVWKSLERKKNFNERKFMEKWPDLSDFSNIWPDSSA